MRCCSSSYQCLWFDSWLSLLLALLARWWMVVLCHARLRARRRELLSLLLTLEALPSCSICCKKTLARTRERRTTTNIKHNTREQQRTTHPPHNFHLTTFFYCELLLMPTRCTQCEREVPSNHLYCRGCGAIQGAGWDLEVGKSAGEYSYHITSHNFTTNCTHIIVYWPAIYGNDSNFSANF